MFFLQVVTPGPLAQVTLSWHLIGWRYPTCRVCGTPGCTPVPVAVVELRLGSYQRCKSAIG